jgi:hypothetical protein
LMCDLLAMGDNKEGGTLRYIIATIAEHEV